MSFSNSALMYAQSDANQTVPYILADENTFYYQFSRDLYLAKQEVIIESPFITTKKLESLKSIFETLVSKSVKVFVITRDPSEHDYVMSNQSELAIHYFESLGVQVLLSKSHHRKIAMIDRKVIWKGSLNILSHRSSREFMEREEDIQKAKQLFSFLNYDKVSDINNHLLY